MIRFLKEWWVWKRNMRACLLEEYEAFKGYREKDGSVLLVQRRYDYWRDCVKRTEEMRSHRPRWRQRAESY